MQIFVISYYSTNDIIKALNLHAINKVKTEFLKASSYNKVPELML